MLDHTLCLLGSVLEYTFLSLIVSELGYTLDFLLGVLDYISCLLVSVLDYILYLLVC